MSVSKLVEILPPEYGYVVLVAADSVLVNFWLALKVVQARKKFGIEYPKLYGTDEQKEFNCIQRAHQNYLELWPEFLTLLLLGGLQNPKLSAGAGALYLISRVAYAKGYQTGDPSKRHYGAFGVAGLFVLLGNTVCFGFHLLKWNPFKGFKC